MLIRVKHEKTRENSMKNIMTSSMTSSMKKAGKQYPQHCKQALAAEE